MVHQSLLLRLFMLTAFLSLASPATGAIVVQFRLELTDLTGSPITEIRLGNSFRLNTYVQDMRNDSTGGVFAAFLDIDYEAAFAGIRPPTSTQVTYGDKYPDVHRADLTLDGVLNDIGAVSGSLRPIGVDENLLFSVTMLAEAVGQVNFTGRSASNSPFFDVLVYNSNDVVAPSDISFGGTAGTIGFGSAAMRITAVPEPNLAWGLIAGCLGFGTLRRHRAPSA